MIESGLLIIIVAGVFGFCMAWAIGANDVANAVGISVGSKVLTIKQAILIAAIFEAAGAILASGNVTNTIQHGLINIHAEVLQNDPFLFIAGMMSSLLAAAVWLIIASFRGWPVSTTHTVIGAVIGFGLICVGLDNINWNKIIYIIMSWLVSPALSGLLAYVLFNFVKKSIFEDPKPAKKAKNTVPYYVFVVVSIILSVVLFQGLIPLGIKLDNFFAIFLTVAGSLIASIISYFILKAIDLHKAKKSLKESYILVEKVFGVLAVFTACAMAFAHGSNDVANAIAPLVAISSIVKTQSMDIANIMIPYWIIILGAVGIVLGLVMYGYKVIETIGSNITYLTPSRGFVAQLVTATVVVISSGIGIPVSTTHILVGAVLGVGMAGGIDAINLRVVRNIFLSWFITFPIGLVLSVIFFKLINIFLY